MGVVLIKMLALGALLIGIFCLSVVAGTVPIAWTSLFDILLHSIGIVEETTVPSGEAYIINYLRLPRSIFGVLVGSSMAIAGALMQGLFRNPLADPGLIGVSSGAALGAAVVIVLGFTLPLAPVLTLPVFAFCGGVLATVIVMRLSMINGRTNIGNMLLAGIAINAIAGSGTGLLVYVANDEQLRSLTFWTMGSLGSANWDNLPFLAALAFVPAVVGLSLGKTLNAFLLGENEALLLGVPVEKIKYLVIVIVCLIIGTCVSLTGMIGFIGLVVPHLCRMIFGPDNQKVLLGSLLLGASLLVGADLISRTIVSPAELPIGIVTSLVGGPFFLWLLFQKKFLGDL